jgi:hypothetical protein
MNREACHSRQKLSGIVSVVEARSTSMTRLGTDFVDGLEALRTTLTRRPAANACSISAAGHHSMTDARLRQPDG